LAASFPAPDLEPLAWIGLVPLLVAARGLRPGAAFRIGWLGGFVFYLATVYWVAYTIGSYTTVPLAVALGILALMASALACYTGAFVAGVRWLAARGLPVTWLAPLLWVALEWLRGWFFIGFPWAALGYSQYRHHDLVQIAEVAGVYGVSAILVLFNMVIVGILPERGLVGVYLLFGSPAFRRAPSGAIQELNRAYLVSPAGREMATYDKMQLVPFGEYVPYAQALFFVRRIVEAVGDVVPGLVPTVFRLPSARFGV